MPEITVLGLTGSTSVSSSTRAALSACLAAMRRMGATTRMLSADTDLPQFDPGSSGAHAQLSRLLREVSQADGIVLATPAYHGTMSAHLKNMLDHLEGLRDDPRPYLSGRAVGCIAVGSGWQGAVTALSSLRMAVHALRGWPTPLGVPVNSSACRFADDRCSEAHIQGQLELMGEQVVEFAMMRRASPAVRRLHAV